MTRHTKTNTHKVLNSFMLATLVLVIFAGYFISPAYARTNKVLKLDEKLEQYLKVSNVDYGSETTYTVEFWFKSEKDSGQAVMFAATEAGKKSDHGILLQLLNDGSLRFLHRPDWDRSGGTEIIHDSNYHDNTWHHVAAGGRSSSMFLYVDGQFVDGTPVQSGHDNVTMDFYIGRLGENTRHFHGQIDEVRFWKSALTGTAINSRRESTLIGNEFNLRGYWNFDTGNANDLRLTSLPRYDGSLNGGASIRTATDLELDRPTPGVVQVSLESPSLSELNDAINIHSDEDVTLEVDVTTTTISPDVTDTDVFWTDVMTGLNAEPSDDDFNLGPSTNRTYRATDFSSTGLHKISVKAVVTLTNGLEVESRVKEVKVHVWNRPVVLDTPPAAAIPNDATELSDPTKVHWLSEKYVGVVGEPVRLKADGLENNGDTSEVIEKYIWDLKDEGTFEQPASEITEFTPSTSNLNGQITVKAVTNYGIESEVHTFDLKIYDTVDVDAGGPYDGVPGRAVDLLGSIVNLSGYGDDSTTDYTWRVSTESGLRFDGVDNYVRVSNPFSNDTSFTIMLWVNPQAINTGAFQGFTGHQSGNVSTRLPSLWVAPSNGRLHYDSFQGTTRHFGFLDNFFTQANE